MSLFPGVFRDFFWWKSNLKNEKSVVKLGLLIKVVNRLVYNDIFRDSSN